MLKIYEFTGLYTRKTRVSSFGNKSDINSILTHFSIHTYIQTKSHETGNERGTTSMNFNVDVIKCSLNSICFIFF